MSAARQQLIDELANDMAASGIDLRVANKLAPYILLYLEDQNAARQALAAEAPHMAAILGWVQTH